MLKANGCGLLRHTRRTHYHTNTPAAHSATHSPNHCDAVLCCCCSQSHCQFLLFLHRLRGLLHRYPAVCLLTYPPALLSASTVATLHHLSTLALTLHTLPPTSPYRHYDCLLHILPQPPTHSLAGSGNGGSGEWLVECREVVRLEKVSLPPEESRNEEGQGQSQQQQQLQAAVGGRERGRVEVESEVAVVGGGEKAGHRHSHAHGSIGCGSGGGSDW